MAEKLKKLVCLHCGGDVKISEDGKTATCLFCKKEYQIGSSLSDSSLIDYSLATEYWKTFRFADAKRKFLDVIKDDKTFGEAYWGAFVSEYGIEWGENNFGDIIPTCHRAHTVSVYDDENYKNAIKYADDSTEYEELADKIEEVRKGIIEKSNEEEGYDIFICFKATEDVDGRKIKTDDFELGKEIYNEFTRQGYNVFFSAETLLKTTVQEYEPYIFKALSTSRVMLLLCSTNDKIESAWVKNEWGRFLDLKNGNGLIPVCGNKYGPYNPASLPNELRKLNAIEYGVKLFNQLTTKVEAYFPEKVKTREDAERQKRNSEYENQQQQILEMIKQLQEDRARPVEKPLYEISGGNLTKYLGNEKNVVIPDNVRIIKAKSFEKNNLVETVTISEGVKYIENASFAGCKMLTTVEIPESVKSIGSDAFYECESLTSVKLPNDITEISNYLFGWCDSLSEITIPENVTSIGEGAFQYCPSLTEITIPKNVTSIGNYAFEGCNNLKKVYYYCDYSVVKDCFKNNVELIGDTSQDNSDSEDDFQINNGVLEKYVGNGIDVVVPNGVKSIALKAFAGCKNIETISLPESVTSIGSGAFLGCNSLTNIYIGKNVSNIGLAAFSACFSLSQIEVDENNEFYKSVDGDLYSKDGKIFYQFAIGKDDNYFELPSSVTTISKYAFAGARYLEDIRLSNNVQTIQDLAFFDCEKLSSFAIPNSVKSIGDKVFENCISLNKIICNCDTSLLSGKVIDDIEIVSYNSQPQSSGYQSNMKNLSIGDVITFGNYPQGQNGEVKPIEWIVLGANEGKALLISKYALDCVDYHENNSDVTWEDCDLRYWINEDFFDNAFSYNEQQMIRPVTVKADKNPSFDVDTGNDVSDKVFLLSVSEGMSLMKDQNLRKCIATPYAVMQGVYEDESNTLNGKHTCFWWLRTTGANQSKASYVDTEGYFSTEGFDVNAEKILGIRPSIIVKF